jgi:hypothetical protein
MSSRKWPALFIVIAFLTSACGSHSASAGSTPSDRACAIPKLVGDQADHTTVRLCVGQSLRLSLHSTYWGNVSSAPETVVKPIGPTAVTPLAPGACPPGVGCGTVVTEFRGLAPGTATVSAHRTSCGEALLCTPGRRSFTLTVVVG